MAATVNALTLINRVVYPEVVNSRYYTKCDRLREFVQKITKPDVRQNIADYTGTELPIVEAELDGIKCAFDKIFTATIRQDPAYVTADTAEFVEIVNDACDTVFSFNKNRFNWFIKRLTEQDWAFDSLNYGPSEFRAIASILSEYVFDTARVLQLVPPQFSEEDAKEWQNHYKEWGSATFAWYQLTYGNSDMPESVRSDYEKCAALINSVLEQATLSKWFNVTSEKLHNSVAGSRLDTMLHRISREENENPEITVLYSVIKDFHLIYPASLNDDWFELFEQVCDEIGHNNDFKTDMCRFNIPQQSRAKAS